MAGIWSRVAGKPEYSALDYWKYFGLRLVKHAHIRAGADVLDVGCGTGSSLFPASEGTGKHGHVVGIDICDH
jgi:O-methyltransferase/aklanonic acid methyltransferase